MSKKPSSLERVGRFSARHPVIVISTWILVAIITFVTQKAYGGIYQDNFNLKGTQSYQGLSLLSKSDKAASGYGGLVVIHAYKGTIPQQSAAVLQSYSNLASLPDVLSVSNPLAANSPTMSENQTTAYFNINFSVVPKSLGTGYLNSLYTATQPMKKAGLEVEYGGGLDQLTRPTTKDIGSEAIGFGVALVVLLISFGTIAGSILPLLTAFLSVIIGLSLLGLVAAVVTFGTVSPTLAVMIGLGVGIDYAVFLTTRFRQKIIDGFDPISAAGATVKSSGHAVLVAATSVSIALFGLYGSGIGFIGQLGFASVFGVVTAAIGAMTLVPAALGLIGRRIDHFKVRKPVAEASGSTEKDGWYRYALNVARRPWIFLIGGVILMVILTIPLFSMRIGHIGDGADPTSFTDKRAYSLISTAFGPGANGTFQVVIDMAGTKVSASQLEEKLYTSLTSTTDVARASQPTLTPDGKLIVATVVPMTDPQSSQTTTLFNTLLNTTIKQVTAGTGATGYVTGGTASQIQFSQTLASRLPIIILIVVLTAFLLIMSTFRSLILAIKAAALNLLSISAAYGVITAVFQWGWGRSLLGVSENVPIESYVPMMMFAIVFGLSMDYEIFLLSRVKESWDITKDNSLSVAKGISSTARVITAAALIMVSVFAAFVGSPEVEIKMIAIGLATSVLIDATVVRLLLVPAIMNILGTKCWYIPKWLDRVLPHIEAEGAEDEDRREPLTDEAARLAIEGNEYSAPSQEVESSATNG
ncbi:MMPL family transporter [Ferrimicrobium acidiphilum]|uniref:MMPL family transporter n=1 Tax=Ferrimicrobium acidiphilum TaxID=121039 RepID=UPI0017DAB49F|nr:MMPL family transporter [Ferrimicrobium acidiphilum]NNN10511.1 MMPL family transporter [Acidimicrobiaceae bacterium]